MRGPKLKVLMSGVAIFLAVVLGSAARYPATRPSPVADDYAMPECPRFGDWTSWFEMEKRDTSIVAISHHGPLALAKNITDIPEFHDCQRFIKVAGGVNTYLSLTAIFAREDLGEATHSLDSVPDVEAIRTKRISKDSAKALTKAFGRPVAVGEILALQDGYPSLGIEKGFNCLYLFGVVGEQSGLGAQIVPVGRDDKRCTQPLTSMTGGVKLKVSRTQYTSGAVPQVARWEWDAAQNHELMGIECGSRSWCVIGNGDFTAPAAYATGTSARNVLAVQGWYDEQRLALPTTGAPNVGNVIGTIVPAPDLESHTGSSGSSSDFHNTWKPVAYVALSSSSNEYRNKLNLTRAAVTGPGNQVSLCFGSKTACVGDQTISSETCTVTDTQGELPAGRVPRTIAPTTITPTDERWWTKVQNTTDRKSRFYCVVRRGHPGMTIPGVVRWRWAIKDETMWIRCLEGCCEVEAGHS